jgi:hypothetical protein
MKHGANFDLGLQHPEAALDIGQQFVAFNDGPWRQIRGIGHQQQLAVHQFRQIQCRLMNFVVKKFYLLSPQSLSLLGDMGIMRDDQTKIPPG